MAVGPAWRAVSALALAALALAAASPAAAQAPEAKTNLADIEDEVMCPVCGTTLELAEAPQAERQKELIRGLIDEGLTKEQVKDELVAEFGEDVLATPESEGLGLAAWVVPILGILAALGAVGYGLSRTRRRPRAAGPPPLDGEDNERLDAELASYDR